MKKNPWLVAGIILVVVVALLLAAAQFLLPNFVKSKVIDAVHEGCPDCAIFIKTVDISLAHPGLISFHEIRFAGGQGGHSVVEMRMKDLNVDVALMKTNKHTLVFDSIEGIGAEFIYADGDTPKKPEPKSKGEGVKVAVYKAHFEKALFRYAHTKEKRTSILHFRDIDATITNAGNTPDLVDKMAEAHLTGQIEKSGHADLQIAALLRPGPWYVDILLNLENQKLEDLNGFFTPNDGVSLKGDMLRAVANLNLRDETTKSHVEATYRDVEFKEEPTRDRSALSAWFTTLGAGLMLTKTNADFLPKDRMVEIQVAHDKDEPLVHYLLRSAKLGLMEIGKQSDSRKGKKK